MFCYIHMLEFDSVAAQTGHPTRQPFDSKHLTSIRGIWRVGKQAPGRFFLIHEFGLDRQQAKVTAGFYELALV